MRRVGRTALHKDANRARTKAYQRHLKALFDDWLSGVDAKGVSTGSLIWRLDDAAVQWFPQAFANGRHQAYPKRRPSADGQEVLAAKLIANRHYLQNSLAPDMESRIIRYRLDNEPGTLMDALRTSFQSRIEGLYGGAIWSVTEAGFRAGVGQARHDLAVRMTGRIHAEEGDDEEQPQPGDHELAIALGLTLAGLLLLVHDGRQRASINPDLSSPEQGLSDGGLAVQLMELPGTLDAAGVAVLIDYIAEADACEECGGNADDGPYSEEECPIPGDDCQGFNNCRCHLETIVDSSEAA